MSLKEFLINNSKNMLYTNAINSYLLDEQDKKGKREGKKAIHPSSITSPCIRGLYYRFHRVDTKPKPVKTLKILGVGNDMHARYDRYAKKAGILVASNMHLYSKKYRIRAKLDQLVLIDNELILVELKSMKNEKFISLMGKPYDSHYNQVQIYWWLLNEMFESHYNISIFKKYKEYFPVKKAAIFVENKDTQDPDELPIEYDEERIAFLKEKINRILKHIDDNTMPERGYEKGSKECRWCDYSDFCWGEGIVEKLQKINEIIIAGGNDDTSEQE